MHARSNENAQEAFQFLAMGAVVVLFVRMAYLGVLRLVNSSLDDPLSMAIADLDHGYLLADHGTMVMDSMAPSGRLALALLLTLLGSTILSLVAAGLAKLTKLDVLRSTVLGARSGLVIFGSWSLYAALTLPPHCATVQKDGILMTQRPAFLGELTLPLKANELFIPWSTITSIETRSIARQFKGCGSEECVVIVVGDMVHSIAGLLPEGRDCTGSIQAARTSTERLARALRNALPH